MLDYNGTHNAIQTLAASTDHDERNNLLCQILIALNERIHVRFDCDDYIVKQLQRVATACAVQLDPYP